MGAAIFKAGGMAAVLAAGGLALLQAGVRVEGTLAAAPAPPAVPARDADPFGEPLGEPFGGSLDDSTFGEAPFGDPSFAAPPSDEPASGAAGLDDPGFDAWDADPTAAPRPAAPRPAAPVADEEPGDATDWGDERWDMLPPADPTFLPSADDAAFPADRDLTREEPAFGEPPAGPERFRAGDTAVPPTAAAALRVTKDVPAEVAPGQPLVYTITVFNAGNGPARGVSVEEPIPAGTQLEGTNPIADLAGRTLRWNLPELPPGGEETLHVRVVPRGPGTVGSVTVVRCEVEAAGRTRVLAAKLAVTARVAGTPRAGGTFDLIHRLENRGTADAAGVVLRTVLPAGATHASGERDLEYDVGPLPAGDSREITLTLAAADTGPLRIDCEVTGAGVEPVSAAADLAVQPRQLTLTRTGPRTRFVGRHGVYENVVTNVSGEPAPPVRVVEAVPVGMTFERAAAGGRYDAESRTVTWDVAPLRPGASATLSVDLIADDPGEVESRVRLERDGRTAAELVSATAVRGYAAIAPRMRGLNGPLAVGERVGLTVTLENTGTEVAADLAADLSLPPCVRVVEVRGDLTHSRTRTGLRLTPAGPVRRDASVSAVVVVEGVAAGGGTAELSVTAAHLSQPLVRTEPVRVYGE